MRLQPKASEDWMAVYQNYFLDLFNLRYGRIADGVMQFSAGAEP